MAAFRKLKNLVDNLTQTPLEEDAETTADASSGVIFTGVFTAPRQPLPNPDVDKDLLSQLPSLYFEEDGRDPSLYELEEIEASVAGSEADTVQLETVANKRKLLRKQLEVVCRMLSDAVLQNSSAFQAELVRVIELQNSLKEALEVASSSRESLRLARDDFTGHSLRLFAQQRRRCRYRHLLSSLQLLRRLRDTDASLRGLMEVEDYPGAIRLCLDCQEASRRHDQFRCIAELGTKLQDTLVLIEEGLDVALGRIPSRFDAELFSKLQKSYALLGKTESSVDQLLMHFASVIHNTSFNIVLGTVELCNPPSSLNTSANNASSSFCGASSFVTSATEEDSNPFLHASSSQSSTSQNSSSHASSSTSQSFSSSINAFHKKPYSDLCRYVSADSFVPCLIDLCKAFFGILKNYDQVVKWFRAQMKKNEKTEVDDEEDAFGTPPPPLQQHRNGEVDGDLGTGGNIDAHAFAYVKQKLEHGTVRIWQDVQQKVKVFLLASDLSSYKFDEFMQVLRIGNMLISVGSQFCLGTKSEGLKDGLKKQSTNYFKRYHKACLDELRMFLENESWVLLPVKSSFALDQLREFRFLRKIPSSLSNRGRSRSPSSSTHSKNSGGSGSACSSSKASSSARSNNAIFEISRRVFETTKEGESPFDQLCKDEDFEEDVWDDGGGDGGVGGGDSDSDPEELKRDVIEEDDPSPAYSRSFSQLKRTTKFNPDLPLVTNATLNVFRLVGKYIQMMQALEPIATHVLLCMTQLYDFLFYSTFLFFGCSKSTLLGGGNVDHNTLTGSVVGDKMLPSRLRSTLKRIRDELILQGPADGSLPDEGASPRDVGAGLEACLKLAAPSLSPCLDSTEDAASFFCFAERVAASESLFYLTQQMERLRAHVEKLVPFGDKHLLQQFYGTTLTQAAELRRPIYRIVAVQAIDYEAVLNSLVNVSFDIDDIMSQHNSYVDAVLNDLRKLSRRILEMGRTTPVGPAVTNVLWEHVIRLASRTFVEGFSCVKKCTNEGRALMQLDYQHFLMKLETLTDLRPIPDREYVEGYVKAYYLPETSIEQWICEKKAVYSPKQMAGLLSCMPHLNKKARQHFYALLEELTNG